MRNSGEITLIAESRLEEARYFLITESVKVHFIWLGIALN